MENITRYHKRASGLLSPDENGEWVKSKDHVRKEARGKVMNLEVREIDYSVAMKVIVEKHYLHRKCPCSLAVGLFSGEEIVGVAVFGKPASYTLCNGIAGEEESRNVIEFNRMWVCDSMPRNTESWFMSRAIKLCPYQILVSFADTEQGHVGTIYQATNWLYCGESKRQRYFRLKGSAGKGGTQYRRRARMSKEKIVEEFGEEYIEEYYSSLKHRYIMFNCKGKRKRELLKKLRYEIKQYPKQSCGWNER